ncbi:hypothetical protein KJ359_009692 [Pestalotiopsis sp. 9143b]|nr:hypothetical protein KJ359_009692 [Pestalotiopsis sp. 9143b]
MDNTDKHTGAKSPLVATSAEETCKSDTSPPKQPERPDDSTEQDSAATTGINVKPSGIVVGPNDSAAMLQGLDATLNRGAVVSNGVVHRPNCSAWIPQDMIDEINDLEARVVQVEAMVEQMEARLDSDDLEAIPDVTPNRSAWMPTDPIDKLNYLKARGQELLARAQQLMVRAAQLAIEAEQKAAMAMDPNQRGGNAQQ